MNPPLDKIAALLGQPADQLQVLDYQPLALAFVPGSFVTWVLRHRASGETLELTLDEATGQAADPATLRQLDQGQAAARGAKLMPDLLSLLLRHANLAAVPVSVALASPAAAEQLATQLRQLAIDLPPQAHESESAVKLTLSVPQIVHLAASPWVRAIELAGDPEILDLAN